jgi:hypothetical protein
MSARSANVSSSSGPLWSWYQRSNTLQPMITAYQLYGKTVKPRTLGTKTSAKGAKKQVLIFEGLLHHVRSNPICRPLPIQS